MAVNTAPIFTRLGDLSANGAVTFSLPMTLAANDFTGVSANYVLLHTALADGSFIETLRFKARGTNVASAMRVFINNGLTPATAANNFFWDDMVLPATTANATGMTGVQVTMPMRLLMPAGFCVYAGLATAVAGGWGGIAVAGKYIA